MCFCVHTKQVMDNVVPVMRRGGSQQQQVLRARFSAVSAPEVHSAMVSIAASRPTGEGGGGGGEEDTEGERQGVQQALRHRGKRKERGCMT